MGVLAMARSLGKLGCLTSCGTSGRFRSFAAVGGMIALAKWLVNKGESDRGAGARVCLHQPSCSVLLVWPSDSIEWGAAARNGVRRCKPSFGCPTSS